MLPKALQSVTTALGLLPGVGPKTAERYAYFLFRSDKRIADEIAEAVAGLHDKIKSCPVTFALIDAEEEVSPFYADDARDKKTVLVVEEPHVLGGAISPIDGITPDQLHIKELVERIKIDEVAEVIIATNPSVEGESTALLLEKVLREAKPELKLTRLARGLPLGVDLSYADQITLTAALENRTDL